MSSTRLHTSLEAWSKYSCEHFLAKNLGKIQITNYNKSPRMSNFEPAFGLLLPVKLGTYQAESASFSTYTLMGILICLCIFQHHSVVALWKTSSVCVLVLIDLHRWDS